MLEKFTREDMENTMRIRGFSENSIKLYTGQIRNLAAYYHRPPHTLEPEDIKNYQIHLVNEKQVLWSTFNIAVCAMKFFFTMWLETIGIFHVSLFRKNKKLCLLF